MKKLLFVLTVVSLVAIGCDRRGTETGAGGSASEQRQMEESDAGAQDINQAGNNAEDSYSTEQKAGSDIQEEEERKSQDMESGTDVQSGDLQREEAPSSDANLDMGTQDSSVQE